MSKRIKHDQIAIGDFSQLPQPTFVLWPCLAGADAILIVSEYPVIYGQGTSEEGR